ncbi:hypothetical protein [Endozoicomonas acroporae]|uniref:hypothetical protein n=1 Tax=Endozoicomonas acroporae TaxID=1701104 RepID=UPI003D7B72D7
MKNIRNEADRIRQRGYEAASKRKKIAANKAAGKVNKNVWIEGSTNEFLKSYKQRFSLNSDAEAFDHLAKNHKLNKRKKE